MSYDLMVFDPEGVPSDHEGFLKWYEETTQWTEEHSYNDPKVSSTKLLAWFFAMIPLFPPFNGPFAKDDLPDDEATASDYSIGTQAIYVAFAVSKAELAYQITFDLAAKHELAFFNVSSADEEVWLPKAGGLVLAHQRRTTSLLKQVASFFRRH